MSRQLNPTPAGKRILKLKIGEMVCIPWAACPQGMRPSGPGTMGVGEMIFEMTPQPTGLFIKRVH